MQTSEKISSFKDSLSYLASAKSLMRRSSSLEAASLLLCRPQDSKAVYEDISLKLVHSKAMAQDDKDTSLFFSS